MYCGKGFSVNSKQHTFVSATLVLPGPVWRMKTTVPLQLSPLGKPQVGETENMRARVFHENNFVTRES